MKISKPNSIIDDWKKQLKSYSALALLSQFLIAIAFAISLGFGIISPYVGMPVTLGVFALVSFLGFCGRFLKQPSKEDE